MHLKEKSISRIKTSCQKWRNFIPIKSSKIRIFFFFTYLIRLTIKFYSLNQ